ncbi:MAG: hypothetical protein FWE57_06010 [Chitinispirillia bacterium]|nr:hypothetical protein [Chitinispirillia bacterium]
MNRKIIAVLLCASAFLMCQNQVKDPLVKVGRVTLGQHNFEAFTRVARSYPAPFPHYFPAQRQPVSFMVETEAIYQFSKPLKISDRITSSLDWEWKKKFFTATLFFDLMGDNLGFTDAKLTEFYKKSPETFKVQIKTDEGADSSFIPEFDKIKRQVADQLFYETYKPDSAFLERLGDRALDSVMLRNHWIYNVRSNPPEFFMRKLYKENYGEAYTDSTDQIYGDGKLIGSNDIDVIRSWVPENHAQNMRLKELAEWLLKWKLFSDQAQKLGLTSKPEYKEMMHWALRIDIAQQYLKQEILPKHNITKPLISMVRGTDSSLATLIIFDQQISTVQPDPGRISSEMENIVKTRINAKIDKEIFDIRRNVKVTFLQDEFKDERDANPALLIAKADSLREAGWGADTDLDQADALKLIEEAESIYQTLMTNFAFTEHGRRAHSEIAKIQIDKYNSNPNKERWQLNAAINQYRRGQIFDTEEESLCNSFFMIGFTYDEYIKNFALAEANYKWILRNSPACALVSDAEFMMLHLDEPMVSIEEIQARSVRQGRKIDFEDEQLALSDGSE